MNEYQFFPDALEAEPPEEESSGSSIPRQQLKGRGAQSNVANRFERVQLALDPDVLDDEVRDCGASLRSPAQVQTEYFVDQSKSILSENLSPDIPFRFSLNPYRGCTHGCAYCYARPTHEYLGMSAGVDFESKVMVKQQAAELLTKALTKSNWSAEPIMMSGVTDCYQPAERELQITRSCLEVAREFRQPLSIITKNALVERDIDLLAELAQQNLTRVALSITSLDQSLTRDLEPRTSAPAAKLRAIRSLSEAGIPVTVMVAPVIPGLTDSEIPRILEAAKEQGASYAGYILLRLPLTVQSVFTDWLAVMRPAQQAKVQSLIEQTREGQMNQSKFRQRMCGTGPLAEHLRATFHLFAKRYGLETQAPALNRTAFRVPNRAPRQLELF